MNKKILFLALPFLIVIVSFFLYYKKDYVIFPSEKISTSFYSDINAHEEGETLTPEHTVSDSAIYLEFTLKQGFQYPYAGIKFQLDSVDLSAYDNLKVNLNASISKSLKLVVHLPYYKGQDARYPFRILEKEIPLVKGTYETSLEEFSTPGWWYRRNHVNEKEAGLLDFSKALAFLVQNGNSTPFNKREAVVIKSVSLSQNLFPFWITSLTFITTYYAIFLTVIRIKKKNMLVMLPYKELDVKKDSEEEKLFTYLSVHYNDQDMSVEKLNRELGIPVGKVSALIKDKTGVSFRQYLNSVRINEARRLLQSTDFQITQIAYSVGYNTVTHFNKVFKEVENVSPKEYRRTLREHLN